MSWFIHLIWWLNEAVRAVEEWNGRDQYIESKVEGQIRREY